MDFKHLNCFNYFNYFKSFKSFNYLNFFEAFTQPATSLACSQVLPNLK